MSNSLLHSLPIVPATLPLGMRFPVEIRSLVSIQETFSVAYVV